MDTLAKPFQFYYVVPDIINFPTQDKTLAKDFNFLTEMFKFFPKFVDLSYEGKRLAQAGDTNTQTIGGVTVTQEFADALNEYSIPAGSDLENEIYSNTNYDTNTWDPNYHPLDNQEAIDYDGNWTYNANMVSGFVHFNEGVDKDEYYWGEKVAEGLSNVDFTPQASDWNHLEEKKPLGLAGLAVSTTDDRPLDTSLDPDVDQPYFIGDFLSSLGLGNDLSSVNNVLDQFPGLSYYEIVMNAAEGKLSYKNLSPQDQVLLIAAMVESRNRVFKIATDIFGPVASTWSDQQMMDNFSNWMDKNYSQGASHGIDAFRILLETSHMMLNQFAVYSEIDDGAQNGEEMSMLDRYAFGQFSKDSGAEFFNHYDGADILGPQFASDPLCQQYIPADNDASDRGAIFNYIEQLIPGALDNNDLCNYLCKPLRATVNFSPDTAVGDLPLPPDFVVNGQALTPGQLNQLRAMKWLIEQWFGTNRVNNANYNSMPRSESIAPIMDYNGNYNSSLQVAYFNNVPGEEAYGCDGTDLGPGAAVFIPGTFATDAARSYGWDRVAGPFDGVVGEGFMRALWNDPNGKVLSDNGTSPPEAWYAVYNDFRAMYGLAYITPGAVGQMVNGTPTAPFHYDLVRKQFSGLNQDEITGKGGDLDPYRDSWAVHMEGELRNRGDLMDKLRMNIYNFLDQSGTQTYNRAEDKYEEDKEQEEEDDANDEKVADKIQAAHQAEQKQLERALEAAAQRMQKEAQAMLQKTLKKA
jgi:hypothetical protein